MSKLYVCRNGDSLSAQLTQLSQSHYKTSTLKLTRIHKIIILMSLTLRCDQQ